ncbi:hypothetical protein BZA77DRAFT_358759 [Pyronema omphalodes]|nr:hypothetical protein BZA77DRAFT_358759 [Pyronema omphalodes]
MAPVRSVPKHTQHCHCPAHGGGTHPKEWQEQYGCSIHRHVPPIVQGPSPENHPSTLLVRSRGPIPAIRLASPSPPPCPDSMSHFEAYQTAALREFKRQFRIAQEAQWQYEFEEREKLFAKLKAKAPPLSHRMLPLPDHLDKLQDQKLRGDVREMNYNDPVPYWMSPSLRFEETIVSTRSKSYGIKLITALAHAPPSAVQRVMEVRNMMSQMGTSNKARNKEDEAEPIVIM